MTGGIGLLLGFHGSKKLICSCMACGHQWDPSVPPPKKMSVAAKVFLAGMALFGVVLYASRASGAAGILAMVVAFAFVAIAIAGKVVPNAPAPLKDAATAFGRWPGRLVFLCSVLAVGGYWGHSMHSARALRCSAAADYYADGGSPEAHDRLAAKHVDAFPSTIDEAQSICVSLGMNADADRLASARAAAQKAELDARAAKEDADRQAALALEAKIASFPAQAATIKKELADTTAAASKKDWLGADAALTQAQSDLDAFKGTSVEKDPKWLALQKQATTQRTQIKPQVIAALKAAAATP